MTMAQKNDTYVELPCGFDLTIETLQDFIDRAKASGLTRVDVEVDVCPHYASVDGVTLRATRTP
jgi:hypothetical protein